MVHNVSYTIWLGLNEKCLQIQIQNSEDATPHWHEYQISILPLQCNASESMNAKLNRNVVAGYSSEQRIFAQLSNFFKELYERKLQRIIGGQINLRHPKTSRKNWKNIWRQSSDDDLPTIILM